MDFRYTVKIYRPENPCKTEEILILNPAGTAALVNAHLQPVYARMKNSRKLILRRCKAVLAIPCKLTVTPHIKGCFHSLERHKHPFFQKIFLLICDNKFPYIAPGRSILPVNGRRTDLWPSIPWIHGIDIMAVVIPLKLDMAGNLDRSPVLFLKSSFIKSNSVWILRSPERIFRWLLLPAEIPDTIQKHKTDSLWSCLLKKRIYMIWMSIVPVHLKNLRIIQPGNPWISTFHPYFLLLYTQNWGCSPNAFWNSVLPALAVFLL